MILWVVSVCKKTSLYSRVYPSHQGYARVFTHVKFRVYPGSTRRCSLSSAGGRVRKFQVRLLSTIRDLEDLTAARRPGSRAPGLSGLGDQTGPAGAHRTGSAGCRTAGHHGAAALQRQRKTSDAGPEIVQRGPTFRFHKGFEGPSGKDCRRRAPSPAALKSTFPA